MNGSNWAKFLSNLSGSKAFNEAGSKPSPVDHWTSGRKRRGMSDMATAGSDKTWLSNATKPE